MELPTTRPTLLAIFDHHDETVVQRLREELPEWRVVACFADDAIHATRAFRFETVVVVGEARVSPDVWAECAPQRVAYAPTLALVRIAVERLRRPASGTLPPRPRK